jgi:opacity protein-like surface antigen
MPIKFLFTALCLCMLPAFAADDQSERIRALEERVAFLESALRELTGKTLPAAQAIPEAAPVAAPAPPTAAVKPRFEMPPELVPEIGKIGAQVGLLISGSGSPFRLNRGTFQGGFIDLPLVDKPEWMHGKISYEILVGMTESRSTFNTTSNVAQVANLTVLTALNPNGGLQNVTSALTGTGAAPFPVTTSTQTRLRVLQVVPFSLKYTSSVFERWRLRPYGVLGMGIFVTIHNQNPANGTPATFGVRPDAQLPPDILAFVKQAFGGQAPFGGPLVAGQISQSPELEARGLPGGHGNLDLGLHTGYGVEYRVMKSLSLGFDGRWNKIGGTNGGFGTWGTRIGVHF